MNNTAKAAASTALIMAALSPLADFDNVKDYNENVAAVKTFAEIARIENKKEIASNQKTEIQNCLKEKIESMKCKTVKKGLKTPKLKM